MSMKPEGPEQAKILIVVDCPTLRDTTAGRAFSGYNGQEFDRMLQEAGILRTACRIVYLYPDLVPRDDLSSLMPVKKGTVTTDCIYYQKRACKPELLAGLEEAKKEILSCNPNLIIAVGNTSLWALTGKLGVSKWRGSMLTTSNELGLTSARKVIGVYPPSSVMSQWSLRPIVVRDFRRCAKESTTSEYQVPKYNFIIRPTYDQVVRTLDMLYAKVLGAKTKLSVDVETRAGHTACTGIAWSRTESICIPHMSVDDINGYWTSDQEAFIIWKLYKLLTHPNAQIVGQNFIYDTQYFQRHFLFAPNLQFDTMTGQHSCFSTMDKGLDFLSSMYCDYHVYWKDEGKLWNPKLHSEDQYWTYNCMDTVVTYEIAEVEEKNIAQMGLSDVNAFQQELFWPVLNSMNLGVKVDKSKRAEFKAHYTSQMAGHLNWIEGLLGHPFNPKSPKQMSNLFYVDLGQKKVISRKTGSASCDDKALTKIKEREPILKELVDHILAYRSLGVMLSTFIEATLDTDDRMRCSYQIPGAETYRFKSRENAFGSGTNLQNQPAELKPMFVPDEGMTFFDIDLDSADLRIVVAESGEENMAEWLDAGLKPYVMVMKEFYHDDSLEKYLKNMDGTWSLDADGNKIESPQYRLFKSFCHGTHYLGKPKGLATQLKLPESEVESLQKWYFNRFPRIKTWQDRFVARVAGRRMVENIFGYRYYIFDRIEGNVYNQAIAWLPQSSVACVINRGYMNLYKNYPDIQVLLQVHDSLAGQFPTSKTSQCLADLKSACQIVLPYSKPITIPVGIKTSTSSWGECS